MSKPDVVVDLSHMSLEERKEFSLKLLQEHVNPVTYAALMDSIRETVHVTPVMVLACIDALAHFGIYHFGPLAMIAEATGTSIQKVMDVYEEGMAMMQVVKITDPTTTTVQ